MYFVTSKRAGFVLFCMTPSGRAAIGLGEDRRVHLFARRGDGSWETLREWDGDALSHTDLMLTLGEHEEPEAPEGLLDLVPRT